MGGDADDGIRRQDSPRRLNGQVVLPQVNAVGAGGCGEVRPVVHDEEPLTLAAERGDLARNGEDIAGVPLFHAQLEDVRTPCERGFSHGGQRLVRLFGRKQDIQAHGGQRLAARGRRNGPFLQIVHAVTQSLERPTRLGRNDLGDFLEHAERLHGASEVGRGNGAHILAFVFVRGADVPAHVAGAVARVGEILRCQPDGVKGVTKRVSHLLERGGEDGVVPCEPRQVLQHPQRFARAIEVGVDRSCQRGVHLMHVLDRPPSQGGAAAASYRMKRFRKRYSRERSARASPFLMRCAFRCVRLVRYR